MDTGRIGAIAETAIAAEATQLGFTVLRPIAEGLRYDLAFEIGGRFIRVQCKSARCHRDAVVVNLSTGRRRRLSQRYLLTRRDRRRCGLLPRSRTLLRGSDIAFRYERPVLVAAFAGPEWSAGGATLR
ncbi:MAG: hypothetical protein E6G00_10125 [Actinobacteria bacterium]|nr:MAG: hypothetical protein E6G00_10125 [Actinomycetota bacterium]